MNAPTGPIRFLLSAILVVGSTLFAVPATAQLDKPDLIQSFPVGHTPTFLAFDGANIWATNFSDNTVTKLRTSDGGNLGTFAVRLGPQWIH